MILCSQLRRKVRVLQRQNDGANSNSASAGKKAAPTPKAAKKTQSGGAPKPAEGDVASGISNLKVADIPPPRSKGLDVVEEFEKSSSKRSTSFVVVGECRP